uniref:Uncharacterized protein n=1 Tax=Lactuca sativa TaxID=4236 RepID=A0A9R1V8S5_LACSA|nr:hypothetical protein LSAT_V11C600314430 [Lactuca sativa]
MYNTLFSHFVAKVAEVLKISLREEVDAEQEGKNKDAIVLMHDNKSLATHGAPFSDESLAAIEGAGEVGTLWSTLEKLAPHYLEENSIKFTFNLH